MGTGKICVAVVAVVAVCQFAACGSKKDRGTPGSGTNKKPETTGSGSGSNGQTNPPGETSAGSHAGSGSGSGTGSTACADLASPTRRVFPADYPFNRDISALSADAPQTEKYLGASSYYGGAALHPDFGSNFGIPYNVIHSTQLAAADFKTVTFEVADESDAGPYPMPAGILQESGPFQSNPNADHHILVADADTCKIYETYQVDLTSSPLSGYGGAIFDASKTPARPDGWTSSDAAGFAIFPLLVKYDEVASGEVHHAFRFTFQHTADRYVYPAKHKAGLSDQNLPPMGLLIRLKASASLDGLGPQSKVVATALKHYGLYAADNGGSGFFQGEPNAKWDDDDLNGLKRFKLSDFEVVVPGPN